MDNSIVGPILWQLTTTNHRFRNTLILKMQILFVGIIRVVCLGVCWEEEFGILFVGIISKTPLNLSPILLFELVQNSKFGGTQKIN